MTKLVKPSDYARQTGLSRQAIYAQIKNDALPSQKKDGRLYVVTQEAEESETDPQTLQQIIDSKNETIEVLQKNIADLQRSNQDVIAVMKNEIELLKQAFVEMKRIYSDTHTPQALVHASDKKWLSLKQYCKKYDQKKSDKFVKKVKKLYKKDDARVKKEDGDYYIYGKLDD